jgi:hypothetical protein
MSNIVPFPRKGRATFSYLEGCSDGSFALFTNECGHPEEVIGPFRTEAEVREWVVNAARPYRGEIVIDWETFPCAPDPRNGKVYATEINEIKYVDGVERKTCGGFAVMHMAQDGETAAIFRGYETLEEAKAGAARIAQKRNAVLS